MWFTIKYILKRSIAAGIMISIGATIKLCCSNQIIGAVLFSIGLFFICNSNMLLFTGLIGHINKQNWSICLIVWIGNLIGCTVSMLLIRLAKPGLQEIIMNAMSSKIQMNIFSLSILSTFCGILMFLAVSNYKEAPFGDSKLFGIIIAVVVFILSEFEHSIANMAYSVLYISNIKDILECLRVIMISTLFNAIGSIITKNLLKERLIQSGDN